MKKVTLLSKARTVLAATALATLAACQSNSPDPNTNKLQSTPAARQFAQKTNNFSFDFLKRINEQEQRSENIFISPLSLHMALGMLLNGAEGQTADEIKKALQLDGVSLEEANQTYAMLINGLPGADPKVTTKLANSVWYRSNFTPEPSYLSMTKDIFKAQISGEDFSNPATVEKINRWASDNTNGTIKKVVTEIKPEQVLFLLNALYFKGDWQYPFNTQQTADYPFELASGQEKSVKLMSMTRNLRHTDRDKYSAFELPYGNGTYTMTVLLPKAESSVNAVINALNATEWSALQQTMSESKVNVGLPRFTLSYEATLNSTLGQLGMPTAFTDAANFAKISKTTGLKISTVKQNTFVAIDEKGTEAGAVTSIGVEVTSMPPSIICDRPFLFLITEKQTGSVLFMGKIGNPDSK